MAMYEVSAGDVVMGEYEGATEGEALDAYARDAGYESFASLQAQVPGRVSTREVAAA